MIIEKDLEKIKKEAERFFNKAGIEVDIKVKASSENVVDIDLDIDQPQILIGEKGQTLIDVQRLFKILLRKKIPERLNEDLRRWSGIIFYLIIYQFLINFISGNNLVSYSLWLFIGLIFSIIQHYDKSKIKTIKLMNRPLKKALNKNLGRYLENKK